MDIDTLAEQIANPKENPKYLVVDLLQAGYNPLQLVEKVAQRGGTQRLMYLAKVAYGAAQMKQYDASRVEQIIAHTKIAESAQWVHLAPYGQDITKHFVESSPKTALELECRVHSTLTAKEAADWVDLYITRDYLSRNYAAPPRR